MNKTILFILTILGITFLATRLINAQYLDQKFNPAQDQLTNQRIDITSKANELGITESQLEQMLNSSQNYGNPGGDPLPDAMQQRFFTGQAAGDLFGTSVSSAGDVNGDGYDDIIIGAYASGAGGVNAGRAYIYFGGSNINSIPDVILTGAAPGDYFGGSVSAAGDVNGDGYADVIVGAYGNDTGGVDAGRAYIFYGGANMDNIADVLLTGATLGDYFGISVSTAGDVNGDGYVDVIVGAYLNDVRGTNAGRAYVYFGGANMDNIPDVTVSGATAGDFLGYSVSTAGDVNGDGYSDVIVGSHGNDAGGSNAGRVYIYFGGAVMNSSSDIVLTGATAGDNFGYSVSSAGDVNGDGYSDVIVGALYNDAGGNNAGRAYVYFGGPGMDEIADVILTGSAAGDNFGMCVSTAGDVNGDGYSDVIIGAYYNDAGGADAGRAYIYYGGEAMDNIADIVLTGAAAGDYFGVSVAKAGDVNGDGNCDVIVGAPANDANGNNAGRAYLYTNSLTGTDIPDEIFSGSAQDDLLGFSVSTAGDVNGDGYDDVIVGAYLNDEGGNNAGRAYIYFGGANMDNIADIILTGVSEYDYFGSSVSTAGDVNGDGYDDVIVGAYGNDAGGTDAGRVYIYLGGAVMNSSSDFALTGATAGDNFGYSVSSAGDVNGDGYADVIVGAYLNDEGGNNAGRAYIYFGGPFIYNQANVVLTGASAANYFGSSVSTAGDVNGDGYDEVIVGAHYAASIGRAYIYFGGASMDSTADVILTGAALYDDFGSSVSTAGDVNGDGYDDVIVGAPKNDYAADNTGSAYIYFGGANMDNLPDIYLYGVWNEYFGTSVSTAGDINGDGFADVIVGAPRNSVGVVQRGRAYLYLSSPPPVKPRVMSVKDVPFDQGGKVYLNFVRSAYDALNESNIVTEYVVEMSTPPGVNGFSWSQVGSVQPMQNVYYTFVANTPNDSMTNNSGTYYFRITARTSNPNQYWRSNIIYGHSVDNLAPAAPNNFYANLNGSNVNLGWKANTEPDFRNYNIYRSDTPALEELTLITTTTDTTFVDNSPLAGNAYYYIQAFDIHNNGSPYSADSLEAILSANIRIFLEGSYVGGQMSTFLNSSGLIPLNQPYNTSPWNYTGTESVASIPQNIVDWVLVELRSSETLVVETRAAFLKNDGTLVDLDGTSNIKFPSTPEGDYYVVIKHRNHLPIMTANKVGINFSPALYDMRTDLTKAYGTNALKNLGGGYFGVFTADTDGSGTVNAADRSNTWNQRNLSGYYGTDVDLSGTVNAADRSSVWNNRNITTQVPASTEKLSTVKTSGVNENE